MIKIHLIDSTWPPDSGKYFSELVLSYDDWNDFMYRTSFDMYYCDDSGDVHIIGGVKIYCWDNDERRTQNYHVHTRLNLGSDIERLDVKYCSLGQDLLYYKNLKDFFPEEYMEILQRLNDIATQDDLKEKFINEQGVQTSLLRFSGAEKALNEAKSLVADDPILEKDISFTYRAHVPYDKSPTELTFDFKKSDYLPYRINILIGKNGTGKTQILSRLANSLSGYTDSIEDNMFVKERPPIDKVMSISYSAFDSFRKPPKREIPRQDESGEFLENDSTQDERSVFSYVYCGIQSEEGTLSLDKLRSKLKNAYEIIKEKERQEIWKEILSELMESEHQKTVQLISEEKFNEVNLSSGQQILICTITELIANIENESIILFDEPEIHLHPNAISNVMRMFYRLLEEFNSYAIFATHSPLIIQEIPSQYIQILNRVEDALIVRKPDVECFGNNVSDIIFDVFDVNDVESNYKTYLKKLSEEKSYKEITKMFDGKLSLNALIYLKNCYSGRE